MAKKRTAKKADPYKGRERKEPAAYERAEEKRAAPKRKSASKKRK
jgi:hypothetical protein